MTTISLRLPDSLHRQLRELASRDGISMNQFAATALAEKIAALTTEVYLGERARRGNRADFDAAFAKISADARPTPDDES
jgi:predicted transcriptional regulator